MEERKAVVCVYGWMGYREFPVVIVGETPKRYRVRFEDDIRMRSSFKRKGTVGLVPKNAVKLYPR